LSKHETDTHQLLLSSSDNDLDRDHLHMSHNICKINRVYSYSTDISCIIRALFSSLRKHYSYDEHSQKILIYSHSDSSLQRILWRNTHHMNKQRSFELFKKKLERRKIVCTLKIAKTKLLQLMMKFTDNWKDHDLMKVEMSNSSHMYVESEESLWKWYLDEKNRNYMHLSIFNLIWMSSISFMRTKVDTFYHCWQEITRLNNEIDQNQRESERYFLMISMFIQFNTQEITYMTCQSIIQCTLLCFRS